MKKNAIAITAFVVLIIVGIAIGMGIALRPPKDAEKNELVIPDPAKIQLPEEYIEMPPYEGYLETFLIDTGYTFNQAKRDDFVYYELFSEDKNPAGFVLPGVGEGWGGPIFMFVMTDMSGIIRRVHVWQHSETPIYVVDLDGFLSTFAGFKVGEELRWQSDVHGLTGATLTAEAVITAVRDVGQIASEKGIYTER